MFISNKIINGKAYSEKLIESLLENQKGSKGPNLLIIQVGDNPASSIYINNKIRLGEKANVKTTHLTLPDNATEKQVIDLIEQGNQDINIDGILLQLPLPPHLDASKITNFIDPNKDVDGLTTYNQGLLLQGIPQFVPCTAMGVLKLINLVEEDISGKHVVILGRSQIVGKPTALLMLSKDASVTMLHSKSKNIQEISSKADILISATGKPQFIDETYVKEGAIVIDVGINRNPEGKIVGDVNIESSLNKVRAITPVPGGVGPMTVACLMLNVYQAFSNRDTRFGLLHK